MKEKNSQSQSLENFFPMHCFLKLLEDVLHQNEGVIPRKEKKKKKLNQTQEQWWEAAEGAHRVVPRTWASEPQD